MGFMDKVKATAEKAAEKAQQGVQQGQQKLSEVQERKRVDGLLRDLGALVYLDRAGRGSPATSAEIERVTAELREAEAAGTMVEAPSAAPPAAPATEAPPVSADAPPPPPPPPPAPNAAEPTPPGSYKLDDV
jgi:hypothetical protein